MDLFFTESGDIKLTSTGDIAKTDSIDPTKTPRVRSSTYASAQRDVCQQAFIRIMTEIGDYVLYPDLGTSLEENLVGLPNTPETAELGKSLIRASLKKGRTSTFIPFIKAIPVGPQAIRFDIYFTIGSKTELGLSIQQSLNTTFALEG